MWNVSEDTHDAPLPIARGGDKFLWNQNDYTLKLSNGDSPLIGPTRRWFTLNIDRGKVAGGPPFILVITFM